MLAMFAGDKVVYWAESALKGLYLADYQFNKYKSAAKTEDKEVEVGVLTTLEPGEFKLMLNRATYVSDAVKYARDLVNDRRTR